MKTYSEEDLETLGELITRINVHRDLQKSIKETSSTITPEQPFVLNFGAANSKYINAAFAPDTAQRILQIILDDMDDVIRQCAIELEESFNIIIE
jgi:hypothetical protein